MHRCKGRSTAAVAKWHDSVMKKNKNLRRSGVEWKLKKNSDEVPVIRKCVHVVVFGNFSHKTTGVIDLAGRPPSDCRDVEVLKMYGENFNCSK